MLAMTQALLGWYRLQARVLPWRAPPGAPRMDPYRVWLSEVMLQQTTVASVIPYFQRFTQRWPTVAALAAAPSEEVMAAWAGLGYYSRARRLVECAQVVAGMGAFPQDEVALRALPGLGAYTAAAVAAIAFGRRAVVVDGNVERVVTRLFTIDTPLPAARTEIRAATDRLTPEDDPGDFAQAMMDLGATVCTPRNPKCLICPLAPWCAARGRGTAENYPVKPPKVAKPARKGTAWWIEHEGKVWLVRREGKGLLGGMRALPDDGWTARADGNGQVPLEGVWRDAGAVAHVFTHFSLALSVRVLNLPTACAPAALVPERGEWWPLARLEEAGLPTIFAKAAARAMASGD